MYFWCMALGECVVRRERQFPLQLWKVYCLHSMCNLSTCKLVLENCEFNGRWHHMPFVPSVRHFRVRPDYASFGIPRVLEKPRTWNLSFRRLWEAPSFSYKSASLTRKLMTWGTTKIQLKAAIGAWIYFSGRFLREQKKFFVKEVSCHQIDLSCYIKMICATHSVLEYRVNVPMCVLFLQMLITIPTVRGSIRNEEVKGRL